MPCFCLLYNLIPNVTIINNLGTNIIHIRNEELKRDRLYNYFTSLYDVNGVENWNRILKLDIYIIWKLQRIVLKQCLWNKKST